MIGILKTMLSKKTILKHALIYSSFCLINPFIAQIKNKSFSSNYIIPIIKSPIVPSSLI